MANNTVAAIAVEVVDGFSVTNRWLLYTSLMLTPAQLMSGIGSNSPTNLGFLAFNYYTQIVWYRAAKARTFHALSLLPVHFNLIYSITYLGGISSGNVVMGGFLGFGTAGVILLNTITAWESYKTNLPEGYGTYKFFFFGWRTLNRNWRKFFLVWQIFDSIVAAGAVLTAITKSFQIALDDEGKDEKISWFKYPAIPLGAIVMLTGTWPLIMWTELIIQRNHIESETDMLSVYMFIAQVGTLLLPSCIPIVKLILNRKT